MHVFMNMMKIMHVHCVHTVLVVSFVHLAPGMKSACRVKWLPVSRTDEAHWKCLQD